MLESLKRKKNCQRLSHYLRVSLQFVDCLVLVSHTKKFQTQTENSHPYRKNFNVVRLCSQG